MYVIFSYTENVYFNIKLFYFICLILDLCDRLLIYRIKYKLLLINTYKIKYKIN